LSDNQLSHILDAAQPLQPDDRSAFLLDVAQALQGREIGDGRSLAHAQRCNANFCGRPTLSRAGVIAAAALSVMIGASRAG